jgi:proteasome lid subunit RPN8/RPN11
MPVLIPPEYLEKIFRHAEEDYPREACGILMGPKSEKEKVTNFHPCKNVQDDYHHQDPVSFPRTSQTAYFMDPASLLRLQKEARQTESEIRVIYHSHVNAKAYFSEEDQRIALSEGRPTYPGVSYLVVSVKDRIAKEANLFSWDEKGKTFVRHPLRSSC